jgi:hypothetical protein
MYPFDGAAYKALKHSPRIGQQTKGGVPTDIVFAARKMASVR